MGRNWKAVYFRFSFSSVDSSELVLFAFHSAVLFNVQKESNLQLAHKNPTKSTNEDLM